MHGSTGGASTCDDGRSHFCLTWCTNGCIPHSGLPTDVDDHHSLLEIKLVPASEDNMTINETKWISWVSDDIWSTGKITKKKVLESEDVASFSQLVPGTAQAVGLTVILDLILMFVTYSLTYCIIVTLYIILSLCLCWWLGLVHWIARRFLVVSPLAAENFLRSLSSRILLFWSRMFASARSWYSPTWRAERSKSAGSIWPFVGPSANISSVGHHLVTNPQLCLTMVMSMATLPSSVLETEDMEVRLSYKLLQSVTLIMGPA